MPPIEHDRTTTSSIQRSPNMILRRTNFAYMEQPIRCVLTCHAKPNEYLSCDGRPVFLSGDNFTNTNNEFALIPLLDDGTILIQNTKTGRYLASSAEGRVFANLEHEEDGFQKWTLTATYDGYSITSLATHRKLACEGSVVSAVKKGESIMEDDFSAATTTWSLNLISGELGFLSFSKQQMRVRCDLTGKLSLSQNWKGWEAWRFCEVGTNNNNIRISPWANAKIFLSSNDYGEVCTRECMGDSEEWNVRKSRVGEFEGLVIQSVKTNRLLVYNDDTESLCTVEDTGNILEENGSCICHFESLHQKTYYLNSIAGENNDQRLEATKNGVVGTRNLPVRITSEEWKIETTNEDAVVKLFSLNCKSYLSSTKSGELMLIDGKTDNDEYSQDSWVMIHDNEDKYDDGSDEWIIEERDEGSVLISKMHQRVLVCPKGPDSICTVLPGTILEGGSTRWTLEPKTPRQVTKEKIHAVGAAALLGVATSVATPLVFGATIGIVGITQIGWAGQVAMGSIRAIEATATITRVTLSSSQLMRRNSSSTVFSKSSSTARERENNDMSENTSIQNRPFCDWRSW
eukprot:CAMPEP_0194200316 /NCGR_PEP_ID=MMETSP0156-20130528/972_1 /TAXON_ID=33649 /ORGANISM="Thalassionema nitzschioides, Strain L26-B" /LENGTH=572 /DNA_ID=CAMNT_0038925293 /DNA_START=61 /DNA_END=1779 /DNA_ORIENTATION=-